MATVEAARPFGLTLDLDATLPPVVPPTWVREWYDEELQVGFVELDGEIVRRRAVVMTTTQVQKEGDDRASDSEDDPDEEQS